MVSGDHGSGKSLLVSAIGSYFKKHPKFLTSKSIFNSKLFIITDLRRFWKA
jgi:chromosomal replication initiation ATPase DnaA